MWLEYREWRPTYQLLTGVKGGPIGEGVTKERTNRNKGFTVKKGHGVTDR